MNCCEMLVISQKLVVYDYIAYILLLLQYSKTSLYRTSRDQC